VRLSHVSSSSLFPYTTLFRSMCAGVVAMIAFHVFQNIGMTIGLMPITGIPLPFISYGGSGLLANMMVIGIVLSVRYHYKRYMFRSEEHTSELQSRENLVCRLL